MKRVRTSILVFVEWLKRLPFSAWFLVVTYGILTGLVLLALRIPRVVQIPATVPGGVITWQIFVLIIATLFLLGFFIRLMSARLLLETVLGATVFLGVWVYAWALLSWDVALLVSAVFTILQATVRRVYMHDAFMLVGAAGIAIHFAFIFPLRSLAIFLVAVFIYDMFAGRPNGIATVLATSFIHRGIIPGLIVPGDSSGWKSEVTVATKHPASVFLGIGDLVIPLVLVAVAARDSLIGGILVGVGVVVGACWLGSRGASKPYPALIPLLISSSIPMVIALYLF